MWKFWKWKSEVSKRRIISDVFPSADCRWYDSCICTTSKPAYCSKCKFYLTIDSGYGWCKALPIPVVVAWCKDVCGLFGKEVRWERGKVICGK